ncbi:MATE family efflux transporter [Agrobacterium vitis]|uniref:MATE family efflux transporter n=1 Tax=Agrobacterium vitis TaxID=373 RepID=UPI000872FBDC|nr:MATE family efflux transporter [Agrobacterium vitis]MCE6078071.1 MATE family efflux transporter [Agrobacterium vitis]MUO72851.1 MATE family efflux transporter [Agrobacterium vitis]MUO86910.1 MATE family efflux transporter [Agrobacterium vitis]MVA37940.1 MATE family efflux transporter [Agrobacterium vitis]
MQTVETLGDADLPRRPPSARTTKSLFRLSLPMFVHSLLTFLVMLSEMLIVSAYSADAAAAVAIVRQVLQVVFEISSMVGIGAVILISHSLGRGDEEGARQIAALAVFTNTLLGLLVGGLLFLGGPVILRILDVPASIVHDASLYLSVAAAAMAFNALATAAIASLRAFGSSRVIVMTGLLLSVIYIGATYVLVLGAGPIPPFGVTGAAYATLGSRIAMALMFGLAVYYTLGLRFVAGPIRARLSLVRRMLVLAFPSVSDYIGYGFYQLVLLGFVAGFGVSSVLSRTYVMLAMTFLILVIMAVSQGNEVLVGYRWGEGRRQDAYRQALRSSLAATVVTMAIALLFWLLSDQYLGLFGQGGEVLELSTYLLLLTIFIQPGFAFNTVLLHSLRAVGDARVPVLVSIGLTWGLGLPLAWLFCVEVGYGVEGVWYALIIEETLKAGFMLSRWRARGWMRNAIA